MFKNLTILRIDQGHKIQSGKSIWNVFHVKCFQEMLI